MRLADRGIIRVDGKINQPLIGKGIAFYEMALIHYYQVLQQAGPQTLAETLSVESSLNAGQ